MAMMTEATIASGIKNVKHYVEKIVEVFGADSAKNLNNFFYISLFFGGFAHSWEEDYITNGFLVGHEHNQTINADTNTTCRWHAYL